MNKETKKICKILAPLDGSPIGDCILNYTRLIASGCENPEVHLLHILEPMPYALASKQCVAEYLVTREEDNIRWANDYLEEKRKEMQSDGIKACRVLLKGKAAETIISYAVENAIDLIVISNHGRSGFTKLVLGSVADMVARESPVPVLITRPRGCKAKEQPQALEDRITV